MSDQSTYQSLAPRALVTVVTNSNIQVRSLPPAPSARINNNASGGDNIRPLTGLADAASSPTTLQNINASASYNELDGIGDLSTSDNTNIPSSINSSLKPVTFSYPSDLMQRVCMFLYLAEYNSQVGLGATDRIQHDTSIALPIPASLLDNLGLDYNTFSLGVLGGPVAQSLDRIATAGSNGEGARQIATNMMNQTKAEISRLYYNADSANISKAIMMRMASSVSGTLGSAFGISLGAVPNPHVAVNFNNVKLRTFSFSWKFSPNSAEESNELVSIIQTLQRRSLPKKDGVLLEYPSQCKIEFRPTPFNDLFKFKPCVIDGINVNYAPNGIPSFFVGTQLPTEIDLNISLQEIQIRTANDYSSGRER
jgi:hypothetical protein